MQHRRHWRRTLRRSWPLLALSLLAVVLFGVANWPAIAPVSQSTAPAVTETASPQVAAEPTPAVISPTPAPTESTLPKQIRALDVPFAPQAPHRNWDEIHKETCEEASVLMVHYYLTGKQSVTADEIEADLQKLIAWEKENLGVYEDTTAAQTARMLADYFGYGDRVRIIENATLEDLKQELAAERPVIAPAAGRLLENRFFQTPGPIYHMNVAIGYTARDIITNDPGTRRGAGYRYPSATYWNAVHDFVDRTDAGMATGAKRLIVVD